MRAFLYYLLYLKWYYINIHRQWFTRALENLYYFVLMNDYNILHQFMQFILLLTPNCFIVTFHVYSFTRFVKIFDKSDLRFDSIWLKFVVWPTSSVIRALFKPLLVKSFAIIHWSLLQIFFIARNALSTFHMYLSCCHEN